MVINMNIEKRIIKYSISLLMASTKTQEVREQTVEGRA
jgi:hypothetical protein